MLRDLQRHVAHAGGDAGPHHNMADVHTRLAGCLQQLVAKEIVAHATHHGDIRTQPGALQRLVGTLAAGGHVECFSVNGLSGMGHPLRCGDNVHNKAAHD